MKGMTHNLSARRWHYGYLGGLAVLLGCCLSSLALAVDVTISDAKIRAMSSISKNTAAYVMIKNNSDQSVYLVAADVMNSQGRSIADKVEIHTARIESGMMKMEHLTGISIEPGKTVRLSSGGNRIMVMGLNQPLSIGENMIISLSFSDGDRIKVDAPVVKVLMDAKPQSVMDHRRALTVSGLATNRPILLEQSL